MITKDSYLQMQVILHDGFKYKFAVRGFNLKSWLTFQNSLRSTKECSYKVITEKEWNKLYYGEEIYSECPGDTGKRRRNTRTATKNAKGVAVERGRRTRNTTGKRKYNTKEKR